MGESTIRAATKRLAEQGLIRVYYRHRSSGLRRSCRYQLMVDGPDTAEPETVDWAACRRPPDDGNRSEPAEDNRSELADEPLGASGSARSELAVIPSKEPSLKNESPKGTSGAPRPMRATRLPDGFMPDEKMRAWFVGENLQLAIADPRVEHEKFCDYFRAAPGVKGSKVDWPATWRNWMRTAAERSGGYRPAPGTSGAPYRSTTDAKVQQTLGLVEKYRKMEENA